MTTTNTAEQTTLRISLPFSGFYHSIWDAMLDDTFELLADINDHDIAQDVSEAEHERLLDNFDFDKFKPVFAHEFSSRLADYMNDLASDFGVTLNLTFSNAEMISPRFYNFETDRIFADISLKDAHAIRLLAELDETELTKVIEARHSSHAGFFSFYSDDLLDWKATETQALDANQLETYLLAAFDELQVEGYEGFEGELAEDLRETFINLVSELTEQDTTA